MENFFFGYVCFSRGSEKSGGSACGLRNCGIFFSVTSVFRVGLKKSGNSRESEKSGDFACGLKGIVENLFRSVFRACLKKKWGFSHESEGKLWGESRGEKVKTNTQNSREFFSHIETHGQKIDSH